MYSACIYCNLPLGANEAVEHFPVGRRLAFDAAKGRLWAVCPHCARWNLTPLEERWEAIEECERRFRDTRLRAQTDQIGLARLRDGLELIRIGQPLRPEFAAWRYGDMFGARLRHTLALGAIGLASAGAVFAAIAATGLLHVGEIGLYVLPLGAGWGVPALVNLPRAWRDYFRTTHVPRRGGRPYAVIGANLKETHLVTVPGTDDWVLQFRHMTGAELLRGDTARRTLAVLLARVNEIGATADTTRLAGERIAALGGPERFVTKLAALSVARTGDYAERRARFRRTGLSEEYRNSPPVDRGSLPRLPAVERLALEMAVHEEEERRAMEGELALLEAAWRDAEEIAAIADDLLVPSGVRASLARLRKRAGDGSGS